MVAEVIPLLAQIPLVGIFVWFVLQRDKAQSKRDGDLFATLALRDEGWKEYLGDLQARTEASNGHLLKSSEETCTALQALTKQVAMLNVSLLYHDATSKGQAPDTLGSTQELLDRLIAQRGLQ